MIDNQSEDIPSGDDITIEIEVDLPDDTGPDDLTQSDVTFALIDSDDTHLVTKTTGDDEITIGGADDQTAFVELDGDDTIDIDGKYRFEVAEDYPTNDGDTHQATLARGVLYIDETSID